MTGVFPVFQRPMVNNGSFPFNGALELAGRTVWSLRVRTVASGDRFEGLRRLSGPPEAHGE